MKVRTLVASDWPAVKEIYEKGIATGNATFQTAAPSWEDWDISHLSTCRFVLDEVEISWAGRRYHRYPPVAFMQVLLK